MLKKQLVLSLAALVLLSQGDLALTGFAEETVSSDANEAAALHGSIKVDKAHNSPSINENELKEIEKGTPLEMTVSTTLSGGGVSAAGDQFFAKMTKDYAVDGKVVIPRDTLVHGVLQEVAEPKRMGRNGYLKLGFDYMITPDGREIPIEGGFSNKDSAAKAALKVVGRSTGYTAVGALAGAGLGLKYGGLAGAVASHGYSVAIPAAVIGLVGLTTAMVTKGQTSMITPGSDIRVRLREKLTLPTMNVPDESAHNLQLPGFTPKVLGMRVEKDPWGENTQITLSLDLTNNTENSFSFFEIGLQDEHGSTFYATPFGDTGLWFQKLSPNSHLNGNLTFSVDNPKLRHYLVLFKPYTREPLVKIALTEAMHAGKKTASVRTKVAREQN